MFTLLSIYASSSLLVISIAYVFNIFCIIQYNFTSNGAYMFVKTFFKDNM